MNNLQLQNDLFMSGKKSRIVKGDIIMLENEVILLHRFAKTGDARAFSEVVRWHAGLVYGACLRILADRDRAADAVQDTFFQLLRNAGNIAGSVSARLHRVATRRAIDVVRRDSSIRRRSACWLGNVLTTGYVLP